MLSQGSCEALSLALPPDFVPAVSFIIKAVPLYLAAAVAEERDTGGGKVHEPRLAELRVHFVPSQIR